jgi:hypothetical protein
MSSRWRGPNYSSSGSVADSRLLISVRDEGGEPAAHVFSPLPRLFSYVISQAVTSAILVRFPYILGRGTFPVLSPFTPVRFPYKRD